MLLSLQSSSLHRSCAKELFLVKINLLKAARRQSPAVGALCRRPFLYLPGPNGGALQSSVLRGCVERRPARLFPL